MNRSVGIKAVAIELPKGVRTNQYWHNRHPELVRAIIEKRKARLFATEATRPAEGFEAEMAAFQADPFKGTVERRVLTSGETALTLEAGAARRALAAAGLEAKDVDLVIVCSFLPDHFGAMNAAYLAREVGFEGLAFNLESACSGSLVGLQTACGLVAAGQYRNAMVVASCTYSRDTDPRDMLSFTVGDGAGAILVGEVEPGYGRLGGMGFHTGHSCGALAFENYARDDGSLWFRLRATPEAGSVLKDMAKESLERSVHGALKNAGIALEEIDAFVFNTPFAWYAKFCARTLGVDPARTVNPYALYANTGPALMPTNLYHMAKERPLRRGDLVLFHTIGSVWSAGAMVLRWSGAALGAEPAIASVNAD